MSVVTALTAQNTVGVQGIIPVNSAFVAMQLDSVLSDIGADAIKTGMLVNSKTVDVVTEKIKQFKIEKVVVDPVLASKDGTVLLDEEGRKALRQKLFPLTYLLTPNIPEAEILTGKKITTVAEMSRAAKALQKMGPKYVLVKGGHLEELPVDVLHDGSQRYEFSTQRVPELLARP